MNNLHNDIRMLIETWRIRETNLYRQIDIANAVGNDKYANRLNDIAIEIDNCASSLELLLNTTISKETN